MNCVLFAKMDQVFSKENKTLKKNTGKLEKKFWKSQGILSVRKSGNPVSSYKSNLGLGVLGNWKGTLFL